ncbi:tryptophan 7-halogenase [Chloroflexi bacterium TSY]|nr:tryptophan 7-halogenase [Chloroflexi bacterium TSY]
MTTIREQVKTLTPAQRAQFARQLKHKLTHPAESRQQVDVLIMGGGLAGLTLARQLRQARSDLSILVVEKAQHPVPEAAFKVGESTVEMGAYYLRDVLGLASYLESNQLFKAGLRYYFPADKNEDISQRVEMGAAIIPSVRSHQIDRGCFENMLWTQNQADGIECWGNCSVQKIDLGEPRHAVTVSRDEKELTVASRWIVDASGRAGLLKRQLGLAESSLHNASAVWFRINDKINIDDWSDDPDWRARTPPGIRWLGTNHLMASGYWVWLIPLVNDVTSVGIVADETLHPHREMNRFERALNWLKQHEPQCASAVEDRQHLLQDFRALRRYSHGCQRVFSSQRWCLTGEAGVFTDPFYSPGSDFIGMSNCLVTDLILRELAGEEIQTRLEYYNQSYLDTYRSFMPIFQGQYPLMGNAQVMTTKIVWDWACYWGITALLFFHENKLFDPTWAVSMQDELKRFNVLSATMQAFFQQSRDNKTDPDFNKYLDSCEMKVFQF